MSSFLDSLSPGWTHGLLLAVDVLAGLAVAWGIIWETPEHKSLKQKVATWLVLGGVVVEAVSALLLFMYDEHVSSVQQARINADDKSLAQQGDTIRGLAAVAVKAKADAQDATNGVAALRDQERDLARDLATERAAVERLTKDTKFLKAMTIQMGAALEPRSLDERQYRVLATLKGKVDEVDFASEPGCWDCLTFETQLMRPLEGAGVRTRIFQMYPGSLLVGSVLVRTPKGENPEADPVVLALRQAGFKASGWSQLGLGIWGQQPPDDATLVEVGEREPFQGFRPRPWYNPPKAQ